MYPRLSPPSSGVHPVRHPEILHVQPGPSSPPSVPLPVRNPGVYRNKPWRSFPSLGYHRPKTWGRPPTSTVIIVVSSSQESGSPLYVSTCIHVRHLYRRGPYGQEPGTHHVNPSNVWKVRSSVLTKRLSSGPSTESPGPLVHETQRHRILVRRTKRPGRKGTPDLTTQSSSRSLFLRSDPGRPHYDGERPT